MASQPKNYHSNISMIYSPTLNQSNILIYQLAQAMDWEKYLDLAMVTATEKEMAKD